MDSVSKDALLSEVRRVLRPDGLLVLADAVLEEHGHGHRTGWGHRQVGTRGRMREHMHDNVGDAVPRRIAKAGFTLEPTRPMTLRIGGKIGIELGCSPTRMVSAGRTSKFTGSRETHD